MTLITVAAVILTLWILAFYFARIPLSDKDKQVSMPCTLLASPNESENQTNSHLDWNLEDGLNICGVVVLFVSEIQVEIFYRSPQ